MQPLSTPKDDRIKPEVLRERLAYGLRFGAAAGIGFAVLAWGPDAFILQKAHALFPWLKIILGLAGCGAIGAAAGWLTMRLDRSWLAVFIWLLAAAIFAWLVTVIPLVIAPRLTAALEPELNGLVTVADSSDLLARFGLAVVWVAIFAGITGVLQLPLSDSGIFSTSLLGRVAPALVCIFVMGICGTIVDSLNNEPLRSGLLAVDETIQYAVEHRGQAIDQRDRLRMHLGALRQVQDYLDRPRALTVGGFDRLLGEVVVLVRFGDTWATCASIYSQPSNCRITSP